MYLGHCEKIYIAYIPNPLGCLRTMIMMEMYIQSTKTAFKAELQSGSSCPLNHALEQVTDLQSGNESRNREETDEILTCTRHVLEHI